MSTFFDTFTVSLLLIAVVGGAIAVGSAYVKR